MLVSALAIGITSCLWWLYFFRVKEQLEHAMAHRKGASQSAMARDTFSLFHFPMICGLIIYAYAIEEAMLHAGEPLTIEGKTALATGIFLYNISIIIAYGRATGKMLWRRTGLIIFVSGSACVLPGTNGIWTLAICLVGLVSICILEGRSGRKDQYPATL
jgi:low temperature requirement protein LtrA